MASMNSISCWDTGKNLRCGVVYNVSKNCKLNSVKICLAQIAKSFPIATTLSVDYGRRVRCGVWIIKGSNWSLSREPDFLSTTIVDTGNTDLFPKYRYPSELIFKEVEFEFSGQTIPSTAIVVGLYSQVDGKESTPDGTLCFLKQSSSGTLYLIEEKGKTQSSRPGAMMVTVDTTSYLDNPSKPNLTITDLRYRTLSKQRTQASASAPGDPRSDYPSPHTDMHNVIIGKDKQWNTDFDIQEGCLKDVVVVEADQNNISVSSNWTQGKPIWIHSRSRIKIKFKKLDSSFSSNGVPCKSYISYKVAQGTKSTLKFEEDVTKDNTLIICPHDFGINDNEPMDITFVRELRNNRNAIQAKSEQLKVSFYTYVTPEVKIAYPRNIVKYIETGVGEQTEESNYVMWATEVLNDPHSQSRDASHQICASLNILLTKDGGDNSGLPVFTRIYIAEYPGTYSNDGKFPYPTNDQILSGEVQPTAQWQAIQMDDGALIQLSGLQPEGYTWSSISEDDITLPEHEIPESTVASLDRNKFPHLVISQSTTNAEGETINLYSKDRRMYFRAGYKYYIRVRRFHSAAAGVLGWVQNSSSACGTKYASHFQHIRGGSYWYIANGSPGEDLGTDSYWGANTMYAGNTSTSSSIVVGGYYNGYPIDDSPSWIEKNNKYFEGGSGPQMAKNGEKSRHSWIGPADGSSGLKGDDDRVNEVYPGFSAADYVIIDCVHGITSTGNLISPRPATQEVGADHWLTFAYRHLSKGARGVESFVHPADHLSKIRVNSRTDLNPDGTLPSSVWGDSIASRAFGHTWQGIDNSATRMGHMYHSIIEYIYKCINKWMKENPKSCGGPDDHPRYPCKIKLTIDLPVDYSNGGTAPIIDTGEITLRDDSEGFTPIILELKHFTDNTFLKDYYAWVKGLTFPGYSSGKIRDKIYDNADKSGAEKTFPPESYVFDMDDLSTGIKYGNTYTWFPVINNMSYSSGEFVAGTTLLNPAEVEEGNVNKWPEDFDKTPKYQADIDKGHVPYATNSMQPEWDSKTDGSKRAVSPEFYREYSEHNGYMFTSPAFESNPIGILPTTVVEEFDKGGKQQFTFNDGSTTMSSQRSPGKLFKRVSPLQDCECGIPSSNRRALPTRLDAEYPLVRTSHFLWFKSHIVGGVSGKVVFTWIWDKHQSDGGLPASCVSTGSQTEVNEEREIRDTNPVNPIVPGITTIGTTAQYLNSSGATETAYNLLEVYGEDNGGLGRCLSADDKTAFWFDKDGNPHGVNNESSPRLEGAVEIPIRVRYTPLVQPIITRDSRITGGDAYNPSGPVTSRTSNVISLENSSKESGSANIDSELKKQKNFFVQISYGMFRSAMGGSYTSCYYNVKDDIYTKKYRYLQLTTAGIATLPSKIMDSNEGVKNTITPVNKNQWYSFNSDTFPSVGVCNAYMVVLVPTEATDARKKKINYYKQKPNFYSTRAFETSWSLKSGTKAKPVIVADMAYTEIYKYMNMEGTSKISACEIEDSVIDHNLRTLFNCEFNYHKLRKQYNSSIITNSSSTNTTKKNLLQKQVWYDLVVVPIFTNEDGFGSAERTKFNGEDYDFKFTDGCGKFGSESQSYAGGTSAASTVSYYGSTPLVVRKFLYIAEDKVYGGGTGGGGGGEEPTTVVERPLQTEACIMFPNVNNRLYNTESGLIRECPGFWLNNTFRLICRGPHFRDQATIERGLRSGESTYEMSLEEVTAGELTGSSRCKEFEVSDCMIHFGKYNDVVYIDNGDGTFTKDLKPNGDPFKFNDEDFQQLLNENAMNRQWLNARSIYTMRTNGNAFSKCTPEAKRNGDARDTIKGGSFDSTGEYYSDRFFEFNPSIVKAATPYPEGYYIQIRFLNNEYQSSSQEGQWTEWSGGILGGGVLRANEGASQNLMCKDISLEYCVPVRDYNLIFTEFRHYIKESTPGSNLMSVTPPEAAPGIGGEVSYDYENPYWMNASLNEMKLVKGTGSESPNTLALEDRPNSSPEYIPGSGNYHDAQAETYTKGVETAIVPEDRLPSITESGHTYTNTDYPHRPQIHSLQSNGTFRNEASKYPIPQEVIDRHQTYWEMNYVDYIIRNMAKLYQSDWSEAIPNGVETVVTSEDVGWTKAKAFAYSEWTRWNDNLEDWDRDLAHLRKDSESDVEVNSSLQVTSRLSEGDSPVVSKVANIPYNVNRYYRKNISTQDFDSLLDVLKHMVTFIRDPKFTGTPNNDIDPKGEDGKSTGFSVLPISADALEFDKMHPTRMIIGHTMNMRDADSLNENNKHWNLVDSNYVQQLMSAVVTKVTTDSVAIDIET